MVGIDDWDCEYTGYTTELASKFIGNKAVDLMNESRKIRMSDM